MAGRICCKRLLTGCDLAGAAGCSFGAAGFVAGSSGGEFLICDAGTGVMKALLLERDRTNLHFTLSANHVTGVSPGISSICD